MPLAGLRGGPKALDPFDFCRDRSNFLRTFAEAAKIHVKRPVAKESAKRVDPVAEALEDVVKLRATDYFAVSTQKGRGKEPDGDSLH